MARHRQHRKFDPLLPVHVWRKPLLIGGQVFRSGATLPWQDLGLDHRKVQQLWGQRRVDHEMPTVVVPPTIKRRGRPPRTPQPLE